MNPSSNASLALQHIGKGKRFVMIPGWGMHTGFLHSLASIIATKAQVTLVDLPGCGGSIDADIPYHLDAITDALDRQIKEAAVYIGWSLGGIIAMHMAKRYPNKVSHLITLASSPRFVADNQWPGIEASLLMQFAEQCRIAPQETREHFFQLQCLGLTQPKKTRQTINQLNRGQPAPTLEALLGGLRLLTESDQRDNLMTLDSPILMLFGGQDKIVPVLTAEAISQQHPDICCVTVPEASHMPSVTHHTACWESIERWLA